MQQCSFVKIKARQITKFTMISIPCDVFHLLYFSRCLSIPLAVGGWNFSDVDFEIITFVMINVIVVVQIEKKTKQRISGILDTRLLWCELHFPPHKHFSFQSRHYFLFAFFIESTDTSLYTISFAPTKNKKKSGRYCSSCWLISYFLCFTTAQLTACQRRLEKNP